MTKKIIVSGVGCCLVDLLYNDIDFGGSAMRRPLELNGVTGASLPVSLSSGRNLKSSVPNHSTLF